MVPLHCTVPPLEDVREGVDGERGTEDARERAGIVFVSDGGQLKDSKEGYKGGGDNTPSDRGREGGV